MSSLRGQEIRRLPASSAATPTTPQIVWQNLSPSEAIEAKIRKQIAKLYQSLVEERQIDIWSLP